MSLVEGRGLTKEFFAGAGGLSLGAKPRLVALAGVSISIDPGETVALVGESGSGKTTAARILLGLLSPTSGEVFFKGREIVSLGAAELRSLRASMQVVFQDPYESLNPRMTVLESVCEPLLVHRRASGREAERLACELLAEVGLEPGLARRYPHQLSSGQRQRVGIARAMVLRPEFVVCDEPVSALDVSIQAQIIRLLAGLQREHGIAYLFISHDLAVVQAIAQRVAVMYLGRIVEEGPVKDVYSAPHHPYTQALLSAVPEPDPVAERTRKRIILNGEIPSPLNPPSGCGFNTRCPLATDVCLADRPTPVNVSRGHSAWCHFATANPIAPELASSPAERPRYC